MRKPGALMLCLVALSACRREPDFDERYEAANSKVRDMARQIDAQIAGTGTPSPDAVEER